MLKFSKLKAMGMRIPRQLRSVVKVLLQYCPVVDHDSLQATREYETARELLKAIRTANRGIGVSRQDAGFTNHLKGVENP
jgi:hypothetical protein